jgi:hypothetical protein
VMVGAEQTQVLQFGLAAVEPVDDMVEDVCQSDRPGIKPLGWLNPMA